MFAFPGASNLSRAAGLFLLLTMGCATYDFDRTRQQLAGASPAKVRACLGTPDELTIQKNNELLHFSRKIGQPGTVRYSPHHGLALVDPSSLRTCEYVFRVGRDGVDGFAVRGFTSAGLRDDRRCLYRLSQCLDSR